MALGNPRTRRPAFWMLAAVLAALGILMITSVAGEAQANSTVDLAGEEMNVTPSTAGEVGGDPGTLDGKYMILWSDAAITGTVTTAGPVGEVVLRARGDQCEGAPQATLLIDGRQVMSATVTSTVWEDYVARASLPAGEHTVEVRFTNDWNVDPSCDRNLVVDKVSLIPESGSGALLFADRFNRERDTFWRHWDFVSRAESGRLTTSADYVRKGAYSAKFTVRDEDVWPLTPSENPRAQLSKVALFCEGDERWIGWSMYFPDDFPDLPSDGWVNVGSLGFAPPFDDDAPFSINVQLLNSGNSIYISRDSTYGEQRYGETIIWTEPLMRGGWYDWVFHIKFSRNGDEGFVEIWKNGQKQELPNGETKLFYRTLETETYPHCGNLQVANYRKRGMFDRLTMYHDQVKVGTSRAAVIP
jgi:polysaccharide lyase-like protein/predicted xylan-binding protein with Ca-dependent carbohydrate-binding module